MKHLFYLTLILLVATRCSTEELPDQKPPYEVSMKFQVNGVDQIVTARFSYDPTQVRYILTKNELLSEIRAIDQFTKKQIFVYTIILNNEELIDSRNQFNVRTGYDGHSQETGCFYYGTLYTGYNGQSVFVAASGVNAVDNPPLCGYFYA